MIWRGEVLASGEDPSRRSRQRDHGQGEYEQGDALHCFLSQPSFPSL